MYRGIFWIVDRHDLSKNKEYLFKIKTDKEGTVLEHDLPLNSRNGNNYAHKQTWKELPYVLTRNKSFDYYPRGRVEIRKGKCRIYLNPNINRPEIVEYLINEFEPNDFIQIEVIEDHSNHYKSEMEKIDEGNN